MEKRGGRGGKNRGKGRGNQRVNQQQQCPAQPSASQPQVASNPWNKMPQSQPQAKSEQQPAGTPSAPCNKEAPSVAIPGPSSAAPARATQPQQRPAESRGAGDSSGSGSVRQQMSKMSIAGPSGDVTNPPKKKFEKPGILKTKPEHITNKKGNYGNVIQLDTNYFRFSGRSDWSIYQYRVDFLPDEDRTNVKRRLFNRIPENNFVPNIFDGNVLTTVHHETRQLEFTVAHTEDPQKTVNIRIRLVAALQNKLDYGFIQLFNLLSRRGLENLDLSLLGRNYYDPRATVVIQQFGLEVWPGYLTSIRQHERETLMCVEIIGKVMRQETIYDILVQCEGRNPRNLQKEFKNEVLGAVVLTSYTNRTYKIDDVDFSVTPNDTFTQRNGEKTTYVQYLREKYQVNIRNKTQPMLVSKANARQRRSGMTELIYLVPELCRTTGLTDRMRNDFNLMKEVGKYTCCDPNSRIQRLIAFNQRMQNNQRTRDQWNQWGLSLGENILKVDGRVMQPEEVYFGDNKPEKTSDWTKALQSIKPIVSQGILDNWFIIHPKNCSVINDLKKLLQQASTGMKFRIGRPQEVALPNDNPATYVSMIENIMNKTTPQMIFFVVPNANVNRYSSIKQKCCVDRPVPSQVVREQSVKKRNALSIMTNVVIQMNCKVGGVPWKVILPARDMMVIGFDVCHDTAKNGFDYGALVASINPDCTKYYSSVISHNKGEEICETIAEHMEAALESYKKNNGQYPRRIFMYRDGVGEGQLDEVYRVEVQKILGMLKNKLETPPVLTYIIVTKRINTRLFYKNQNPDPGTIVDDTITDPDKYDFFLVSAKATVGTITPTSYNVIYDENRLSPAQLQRFTFKLTHLYFNCSKTVRVPAPCHYAHKLAFLVSQFVHTKPSKHLSEVLYFL